MAMASLTYFSDAGFGSFVDKTLLPYTDTNEAKLQRPCADKNEPCQPAFGFQHVLSLTKDGEMFSKMVAQQHISGNLDPPEGSLDAIMQVAVCVVRLRTLHITCIRGTNLFWQPYYLLMRTASSTLCTKECELYVMLSETCLNP